MSDPGRGELISGETRRVVSGHENSKATGRFCTPLVVFQRSRVTGHLICCALKPSCGRRLWRQVAGGGVVAGGVWTWASGACPCRQPVPIHSLSPSTALVCRTDDGISPVSERPGAVCARSARNGLFFTGLSLGSGWERRPVHPHAHPALTLHTKPEVNLDCVLAAARGCALVSVPRRSPPSVSRYSDRPPAPASSTHPSLALHRCGLISAAFCIARPRSRCCKVASARLAAAAAGSSSRSRGARCQQRPRPRTAH